MVYLIPSPVNTNILIQGELLISNNVFNRARNNLCAHTKMVSSIVNDRIVLFAS